MGGAILAALLKALEQNPSAVLAVVQSLLDLVKSNPGLLAEIVGSIKARS